MRFAREVVGVVLVVAVALGVLRERWNARRAGKVHARAASIRRKKATPAQLAVVLLGFAAMGSIALLLVKAFWWLHWYPNARAPFLEFRTEAGGFLIVLPAMLAAIGPGLLVANFVARLVRPWGRVLDREAQEVPGGDYRSAQKALVQCSAVLFAIALPLMIAGVLVGR